MIDWTEAGNAVNQLIELAGDEGFRVTRVELRANLDGDGFRVIARDSDDKAFRYAMYVEGTGQPVADGF